MVTARIHGAAAFGGEGCMLGKDKTLTTGRLLFLPSKQSRAERSGAERSIALCR